MQLKDKLEGTTTIVTIAGSVDTQASDDLCAYIMTLIQQGRSQFIFDCKEITDISSGFFRAFIAVEEELHKLHGSFCFKDFPLHFLEIAIQSGLKKYFVPNVI
jgi:anti-anti-sigma regulatory factor